MERQVTLPELAESIVEAEIIEWRVAEGDRVELDEPLVEVASDKVTVDLPSPYAGTLTACLVQAGDTVAVGAPVARIAEDGDDANDAESGAAEPARDQSGNDQSGDDAATGQSASQNGQDSETDADEDDGDSLSLFKPSSGADAAVNNPFLANSDESTDQSADQSADNNIDRGRESAVPAAPAARPPAVPSARIAARRLDVDIGDVTGSGPAGRIRIADVERHAERGAATAPANVGGGGGLAPLGYDTPAGYEDRERRVALRGVRKAIAQQMTNSHLHAVRTLVVEEADMTRLKAVRGALRDKAEARGVGLSFLPFVFKALVSALKAYPEVNTSLDEINNEIVYKDYYSIGLAVAAESGLMVPVVRDVDKRTLIEVAGEINRLSEGAREGRLDTAELRGATCSVTNIGSIGGLMSFPIINVPDAAILGVHSIRERPVAIDGAVQVRPMMYLSLSFDHRLVDGAEATRFLMAIIGLLERPEELLLDTI